MKTSPKWHCQMGSYVGRVGGVLDQDIGSPVVISSSAGGRSGQKAEFLATVASGGELDGVAPGPHGVEGVASFRNPSKTPWGVLGELSNGSGRVDGPFAHPTVASATNDTLFPCAAAARSFVGPTRGCCCAARLRLSSTNTFAFSLLIGVASTGRGVANIFSAAARRSVTIGDVSGGVSLGLAGSGARERVSGSIMLSPHFQVNSKSNSLNCADQRCSLLLCLSRP